MLLLHYIALHVLTSFDHLQVHIYIYIYIYNIKRQLENHTNIKDMHQKMTLMRSKHVVQYNATEVV
jgi:hypothetical protein